MMPFYYTFALILTLLIILLRIVKIYFPTIENNSLHSMIFKSFYYMFTTYIWMIAFMSGMHNYITLPIGIISGLFVGLIYFLYVYKIKQQTIQGNNTDFIGKNGIVVGVQNENENTYIGKINNFDQYIVFKSYENLNTDDEFTIISIINGDFIGKKITN